MALNLNWEVGDYVMQSLYLTLWRRLDQGRTPGYKTVGRQSRDVWSVVFMVLYEVVLAA